MPSETPRTLVCRINDAVADSWCGRRMFQLRERNTTFLSELRAGTVGFLTIAYILAVNASLLSQTGGTCDPATDCAEPGPGCQYTDAQFAQCVVNVKRSLISATAISSLIGCLMMGLIANMPLALAPGMGINAYFTFTVVGYMGSGQISYQEALAAVFVEGFIFLAISFSGVRGRMVELIPRHILYSTAAGIGMFLAFLGLQYSNGIGLITADGATLVTLGGCPEDEQAHMYAWKDDQISWQGICNSTINEKTGAPELTMPPRSSNYECTGAKMRSPTMWLGIWAGVLMVVLMARNVRASILYGVLFATFIAWIPGHGASYLGAGSQIPGGEDRLEYFKKVVQVPNVKATALALDFGALASSDAWVALITFLYLDFLDATSTMFSMARLMSSTIPGFVNEKGQWPRQLLTMLCDGASIVVGALLGTSPLTVVSESAVGIKEGGRTGLTAIVIGLCFGVSMFLAPIFSNIPGYATGPALILVGCLMMEHAVHVDWNDLRQAAPAFLTIILMPLTYSIAYGVLGGILCAITLWVIFTGMDLVKAVLNTEHSDDTMGMRIKLVLLDAFSPLFAAFGGETYLIRNLPGYVPSGGDAERSSHGSDGSNNDVKLELEVATIKAPSGTDRV